jgi:nucleoside 2-deoxyribosyltransferase
MRIYLACTVRGDRSALDAARALRDRLEHHGHTVLTAHLLEDDVEAVESRLTERDVYLRDIDWLSGCDAIVAEASGSSFGVGFEVGYVLGRAPGTSQQAYLLYRTDRRSAISRLISGNADPRCTTRAYDDIADLVRFVDEHFGNQHG